MCSEDTARCSASGVGGGREARASGDAGDVGDVGSEPRMLPDAVSILGQAHPLIIRFFFFILLNF